MKSKLENLKGKEIFNDIDFHFTDLICELSSAEDTDVLRLSSMLLSNDTLQGRHICIDLAKHAGQNLLEYICDADKELEGDLRKISLPGDASSWRETLLRSPVVGTADSQDRKKTPLVIDDKNRLYIYRYWDYERRLAEIVRTKAGFKELDNPARWGQIFAEYSAEQKTKNPKWQVDDWQTLAVFLAIRNRFSVISGGPGTGKTTIAAAVLSLILEDADSKNKNIEIAVCAPTGKAAVRIQESLLKNLSSRIKPGSMTIEAKTIHRLLGYIPDSPYFMHNAKNPLPADIVVVDESSMVSLPLMAKLFKAIRPDAKLILLGDQHQLASVESGAILADICAAADTNKFTRPFLDEFAKFAKPAGKFLRENSSGNMSDTTVSLEKSYRFADDKGIASISRLVNRGEGEAALASLAENKERWNDVGRIELPSKSSLKETLCPIVSGSSYSSLREAGTVADAYRKFNKFRILCSNRKGSYGVERINDMVTEILEMRGAKSSSYFKGCPIIITENDYALKLFNGDTGIVWDGDADGDGSGLRAYFPKPDLSGDFVSFPTSRLPMHETAYAMTIHKAQGSGFKDILLILPDEYNPVLTRELVYTGITRAEETVTMMIRDEIFKLAAKSQIERSSGLQDLLK